MGSRCYGGAEPAVELASVSTTQHMIRPSRRHDKGLDYPNHSCFNHVLPTIFEILSPSTAIDFCLSLNSTDPYEF
jgi:hypothetical protein